MGVMSERVMVLGLVGAAGLASLTSLGDAMGRGIAADTAAADRRASLAVSSEAGLTTELAEAMYRAHLDDLRVVRSQARVVDRHVVRARAPDRGDLFEHREDPRRAFRREPSQAGHRVLQHTRSARTRARVSVSA